ncbi:FecR family protein [Lunatibacter salilacus]|uniref:FecR family protein n=1 Tax=Lunatibacter salilacus TaxID=2483804 RepID=UPI00131D60CE|nr:FecR family protein [Lunatibacter salilacus]
MEKERFFELLDKQAKGLTNQEENRKISDIFDRMQRRSLSWEMNEREEQAIKSRIKRRIDVRLEEKRQVEFHPFPYWRMVASIIFLLGLGYLIFNQSDKEVAPQLVERITGDRQKAVITLQDGSVVHLNVNSSILFPEEFGTDTRNIKLEGEAFFEVVPDKTRPFIVESQGVKTRVLGTSFNVKSTTGNEVEVMVKTGKVAVFQGVVNEEQQLVLSPSQLATVDPSNREMSVQAVDMEDYLTWRSENIAFDLAPFTEVMTRLSKVYNLDIRVEGITGQECLIKATYSNRSLYSVLFGLKNLVDFDYEKTADGNMLIRYRGCRN